MNPANLVVGLRQVRLEYPTPLEPSLLLPFVGGVVIAIRARFLTQNKGRLRRQIDLPDPGGVLHERYRGFDLVFGVAGGFVDEDRSEGRVPSELECTGTHRGGVGMTAIG